MNVAPVHGWLLSRLVELDLASPGLLSHYCLASLERRQVMAAFLSRDLNSVDRHRLTDVGLFLRRARHDAILAAAFSNVPAGFRGALARTAADVQSRRYYIYLHAFLSTSDSSLRRLIERLSNISLDKLRIARALPADARHPDLVYRLTSLREARDLNSFIQLMEERGVDRAAMITAFESHKRPLREVARHWTLKAAFPAHPIPGSAAYQPITSGSDLCDAARDFRNCARVYIADVLDHVTTFAVFNFDERERAIVHLQRESEGGWSLQGLHGLSNRVVSRELRARAEGYLDQHGVLIRRRSQAKSKFDPVRRLSRLYAFEDDD